MITFGAANTSTALEDTGAILWTLFLVSCDRVFVLYCYGYLVGEVRSICESICSDGSNATVQPSGSNQRPRMDIACVLDVTQTVNLAHRKRALEEVRLASELVNANLHHIHVSFLTNTKWELPNFGVISWKNIVDYRYVLQI